MKQDSEMSELKEKMAEFEALNSKWASAESRNKRLTEELKLSEKSSANYAEALRVAESKLSKTEESLEAERREVASTKQKLEETCAAKTAAAATFEKVIAELSEALSICNTNLGHFLNKPAQLKFMM